MVVVWCHIFSVDNICKNHSYFMKVIVGNSNLKARFHTNLNLRGKKGRGAKTSEETCSFPRDFSGFWNLSVFVESCYVFISVVYLKLSNSAKEAEKLVFI